MSHNIFDEQKIFAYRKLISLLEKQDVSFYDNHYTDLVLFSELGIYEKNPIFIIFGLNEFWQDDVESSYISIRLQAEYDKIKDGIEYLTSVYKQGSENIRDGFPLPITDENLNIIGDFPELVELQEANDEELIQRFLNLLLEIYKLGLEKAIYNTNLSIVIAKGDEFSDILKKGSFATNLNILYKNFDRSNFGNEGHFLLTFKNQLEIARELIRSKFETHEINDIVITPQVAFSKRKKFVDDAEHVFDAKIRLLDCLCYLEYTGEIKILELMPSRVVLDATNLSLPQYQSQEMSLNELLKLVINGNKAQILVKETDERLCEFDYSETNKRLRIFKLIAVNYPHPTTRTEIANELGLKLGSLKAGKFNKGKIYSPIMTLNRVIKVQSKGKLSIDSSKASTEGFFLRISL